MNQGILKRASFVGILLLIMLGAILSVLLLAYLEIDNACPFNKYVGLYCPGCGGTRMLLSILKLKIYQAFRYNMFLFITTPIMLIIAVKEILNFILKDTISDYVDKLLITYAISLMTFGILRNISWFNWMAPIKIC